MKQRSSKKAYFTLGSSLSSVQLVVVVVVGLILQTGIGALLLEGPWSLAA